MIKYFRLFIAILMILGLVGLAKSNIAWAAKSSGQSDQSAPQSIGQSDQSDKDDCDKNPNREKCKDKKKKCNPKKENCGSVKPPPKNLIIPVTGDYSIGGFCTLRVEFYGEDYRLAGGIITPLPRPLPEDVHKVELGCLLTHYKSDERIDEMLPEAGIATICFASSPQKEMQIYFYDYYSIDPQWSPLVTTVTDGIACVGANKSGVYVATFETQN